MRSSCIWSTDHTKNHQKGKKKKSHNKKNQFSKTGLIRSNCEHAKQLVSKVAQTHVANFVLNA